jgi:predicted ArsR family transcriptional regulator
LRKNALEYRRDRRTRFREYFKDKKKVPLGLLDSRDLADKTKIPWRTALAYLRELHREGLVHHEARQYCKHGLPFDVAVWSRIK